MSGRTQVAVDGSCCKRVVVVTVAVESVAKYEGEESLAVRADSETDFSLKK